MQVTEFLSEGLKRGYTVVVPASDLEGKRSARLSELGKSLNLPGFRPGKVPASVVRQRYGSRVAAEVLEQSVDDATRQVLSDRGLRPAGQPKVDLVSAEEQTDLEFKVELELLPDIEMPDFAAIELTRLKTEPAPEKIDQALAEIAGRQSDYVDVEEERGAAKGERLIVDFAGRVDGTAFEGGTGQDMSVDVGGPGFIPGFTEQMEGMKPGETREIHVTFPDEYQAKELAGRAATFEITAKSLRRPVPAELNDALAEKLGFGDLGELREAVTGQMQREYDSLSRLRIKRQLLDALAERAQFAVPETMATNEFDAIWRRVEADLKEGRTDDDDKGKDEATLKAEYRAIAERRVRLGLLLAEIGRTNAIQVGADEMTRAMQAEARRYPGQERQVVEFFRSNPQAAETLRGPIFEDKVVDFILEMAKVEEKAVAPDELSADPDAAPAAAAAPSDAQTAAPAADPQAAAADDTAATGK